jgi:hypothetical protein
VNYRTPLIRCNTATVPYRNEIDPAVFDLLTDAQLAWLARVSIRHGKSVDSLLHSMQPVAEQEGEANTVRLVGLLPNCGLYGSLDSDGSSHT